MVVLLTSTTDLHKWLWTSTNILEIFWKTRKPWHAQCITINVFILHCCWCIIFAFVFCSNMSKVSFKHIYVTKDTSANEIIEKAVRKFGLEVCTDSYLIHSIQTCQMLKFSVRISMSLTHFCNIFPNWEWRLNGNPSISLSISIGL